MVNVSPKSNALFEPLSAETVIVEFDNELLPIFDNVLLLLIVLLVSVSVVSFKTIVRIAFGMVTVLSASGFDAIRVVSLSSSDEPQKKTNLSTTFIVELSTVVVVLVQLNPL